MLRSVLIVEDEANMRLVMQMALEQVGFRVLCADSADAAVSLLDDPDLDVILTDLRMPGMDGHEFIRICQQRRDDVPVIVVTAYGSIRSAIECIQAGAANYLTKPFEPEALQFAVQNALRYRDLLRENRQLSAVLQDAQASLRLLGESPAMQALREQIRSLALERTPLLIEGERGTGKRTVAYAIHANSVRAQRPFVAVNCAAIPPERMGEVLFGDARTGLAAQTSARLGKLAQADGGSLYLQGIDRLTPDLQRSLVNVIQERTYSALGCDKLQRADVRLLAATHAASSEARDERLLPDLYRALTASSLTVPALRERPQDIALLAQDFVAELGTQAASTATALSPAAMTALTQYHWPANVRELRHCIEHALLMCRGNLIEPEHLPSCVVAKDTAGMAIKLAALPAEGLDSWLDNLQRSLIVQALDASDGVQIHAARLLGINERSLWHRMKKLNVHVGKKVSKKVSK